MECGNSAYKQIILWHFSFTYAGKEEYQGTGFRPKIPTKNYQIFLSFNIRYKNMVVKKIK
jgi:hypothetical protein